MSKIRADHVFTSESVSEGHPDKVCDQISDAILDACLMQDPESHVACETLATTDLIVISAEITTHADLNLQEIALRVVKKIGYDDPQLGFSDSTAKVLVAVHTQSPDIAQGVNRTEGEQGAGDQGMMFGYASNETPALMPATIYYANQLMEAFAQLRRTDAEAKRYLRPDAKSQVSIHYVNGRPEAVETVVISHQHTADMPIEWLRNKVQEIAEKVIPPELRKKPIRYFVNPTGNFVIGGPHGDTGLTGRKIIVDTYGGVGSHGGGAFSGKDPSKVDRSAAYMCRYIAKNIVAAKLADKCEIQVAYAIGVADPLSINVDTYGTGKLGDDAKLEKVIRQVFDLKPASIVKTLGLKHPGSGWCYQDTAAYGHFGRDRFPWEQCDRVAALQAAAAKL